MTYIIQPGDTLYSIAARFGVPLQSLLAANPGLQGGTVYVGQIITVPVGGAPVPRPPVPPVPPVPPQPPIGGGLEQRVNRLERELRDLERTNREQDRLIRQLDNRVDRLERRVQRLENR